MQDIFYTGLNIQSNPRHGKREYHGMHSKGGIYTVWKAIIQRCTNPKYREYHLYGGRGIGICAEWMYFSNFYHDMGPRPDKMQIDRIDNNLGYSKANCRWATPSMNMINRRRCTTKKSLFRGVYKSSRSKKFGSQIRICGFLYQIGTFESAESASEAYRLVHLEWYGFYPLD